jgi:hypothetical protein
VVAPNRSDFITTPRATQADHKSADASASSNASARRGFVLLGNLNLGNEKGPAALAGPKISKAPNPNERNACYGNSTI